MHTKEGRHDVIAVIRTSDGALVRWVRGARAAAWSEDAAYFALGGPWGVLLALAAPARRGGRAAGDDVRGVAQDRAMPRGRATPAGRRPTIPGVGVQRYPPHLAPSTLVRPRGRG